MNRGSHLALGAAGENAAVQALERDGYVILARGYRTRAGELDIVARDGSCLVFVEVKTRADLRCGHPAEAVTPRKQRKLAAMAQDYLARHDVREGTCRFDVVAVLLGDSGVQVEIIRDAFHVA